MLVLLEVRLFPVEVLYPKILSFQSRHRDSHLRRSKEHLLYMFVSACYKNLYTDQPPRMHPGIPRYIHKDHPEL